MTVPLLRDAVSDLGGDPNLINDAPISDGMREQMVQQLTNACESEPGESSVASVFKDMIESQVDEIFENVGNELGE
jgi:hypothetical protein